MGKQRFRLSHMIPNAWFYRLRDMNTLPHNINNSLSSSSSNNHLTNSFCYTPKLSTNINRPPAAVPKHVLGSIYIRPTESTHTSCYESPLFESCGCRVVSSSTADVNFDTNKTVEDSRGYEFIQEIELQTPPQIITKSKTDNQRRKKGVNKRSNAYKRVVDDENKFSSSCCIVKSTFEPCKELKESMMEMIAEYNIRASKDLENLLAFYLSLNSNEYHHMIVEAFEEIWLTFDFRF